MPGTSAEYDPEFADYLEKSGQPSEGAPPVESGRPTLEVLRGDIDGKLHRDLVAQESELTSTIQEVEKAIALLEERGESDQVVGAYIAEQVRLMAMQSDIREELLRTARADAINEVAPSDEVQRAREAAETEVGKMVNEMVRREIDTLRMELKGAEAQEQSQERYLMERWKLSTVELDTTSGVRSGFKFGWLKLNREFRNVWHSYQRAKEDTARLRDDIHDLEESLEDSQRFAARSQNAWLRAVTTPR
jgi:hypothetical protein